MFAFVNDQFLPEEKATLQVGDLALQRGYAAFDYFRTKDNIPLFLDDYLERFYNSASILHITPTHSKTELSAIIHELIGKNNNGEAGIRMILTGGYSPDNYKPVQPNLVIIEQRIQMPSKEAFTNGIKIISHEYQRDLPAAKSVNYLMGIWLQPHLASRGATDVVYHRDGIITELPRANIFMVTNTGKLVTPLRNILKGITRKKIVELAKAKMTVEERDVQLEELEDAAELFMTSTTKRILPITSINDRTVGNGYAGPIATSLCADFVQMENAAMVLSN